MRPFNAREVENTSKCVIAMTGTTTSEYILKFRSCIMSLILIFAAISGGGGADRTHSFNFDHSYWSYSKDDTHFIGQKHVYEDLGLEMLEHSFEGYCTGFT